MKTFAIAVLVACFVYCHGQDTTCITDPPTEEAIDGQTDVQSLDIRNDIDKALKSDDEVNISVNSIAAQRAFVYQESKSLYTNTCPRSLRYITSLTLYVGPGQKERCYVVSPYRQRVTYALCKGTGCYGSVFYKSQCVRSGWTRLQFWVWCPTCGFKLIARWYPQCCSCYRWTPCLQAADEITGRF